jgi:hypothetical protein
MSQVVEMEHLSTNVIPFSAVGPAKAGIHVGHRMAVPWTPAFAEVTDQERAGVMNGGARR